MKLKQIISLLMVCVFVFALFACGKDADDTQNTTAAVTTANQPTVKTKSSANTQVESDYTVEKVANIKVAKGTPKEDVIAMLPTELEVDVPADSSGASEVLLETDFTTKDAFLENWVMCDADKVSDVYDGKYVTTEASTRVKAYIDYKDWSKYNPESEENNEFANYAIKAVLKGTAEDPTNNFGIIFRATDVTDSGADSYYGLYVGIGNSDGIVCVGYAMNNWNSIKNIDVDYQPNVDQTLEVVVFNENFVVLFNNEVVYEGDCKGFVNGTVGLRTYNQLYECSQYTVRTLGPEDYELFGGYVVKQKLPVSWDCWDYDPEVPGKYGFFGTIVSDLIKTGKAEQKVMVTVNSS